MKKNSNCKYTNYKRSISSLAIIFNKNELYKEYIKRYMKNILLNEFKGLILANNIPFYPTNALR